MPIPIPQHAGAAANGRWCISAKKVPSRLHVRTLAFPIILFVLED
jgi:hypothetical protein